MNPTIVRKQQQLAESIQQAIRKAVDDTNPAYVGKHLVRHVYTGRGHVAFCVVCWQQSADCVFPQDASNNLAASVCGVESDEC